MKFEKEEEGQRDGDGGLPGRPNATKRATEDDSKNRVESELTEKKIGQGKKWGGSKSLGRENPRDDRKSKTTFGKGLNEINTKEKIFLKRPQLERESLDNQEGYLSGEGRV